MRTEALKGPGRHPARGARAGAAPRLRGHGSGQPFAWTRSPANPARLALGSPPGATEHGWVSTLPSS